MVYKLANIIDMNKLPTIDQKTWDILYEYVKVLTYEYGADRSVEEDDGGYVLYAVPGTTPEELRLYFDYPKFHVEYVNRELKATPPLCSAMYILNNDYAVVIIMPIADAPPEITREFEEGY